MPSTIRVLLLSASNPPFHIAFIFIPLCGVKHAIQDHNNNEVLKRVIGYIHRVAGIDITDTFRIGLHED